MPRNPSPPSWSPERRAAQKRKERQALADQLHARFGVRTPRALARKILKLPERWQARIAAFIREEGGDANEHDATR